jgi:hypothetical protein
MKNHQYELWIGTWDTLLEVGKFADVNQAKQYVNTHINGCYYEIRKRKVI